MFVWQECSGLGQSIFRDDDCCQQVWKLADLGQGLFLHFL